MSLTEALETVAGLQTQYAPAGYIGLWSRLEDFRRPALTRALEDRSVVQATVMRATIHMVSAADYWPFALATRPSREQWYLRAAATLLRGVDMDRAVRRVRADLSDGPRRHDELVAGLAEEGIPRTAWNGVAQLVHLVRVPPSGTWEQRRANRYALAEQWLGEPTIDEPAAIVHLVRRYLAGFGPASRADVASWTGLQATALKPAFEALDLRRFRDADGRELIDLPDAPLPDARRPRTRPLLPDLGRQPAGPRPPGRDPARGLPAAHLQHEDAALLPDLPGRRRRRRDVALRGWSRDAGPVRRTSGAAAASGRR